VAGATHLYAIAIGSNRPHGRHGRPAGVVEAAIARLDEEFGLFDASPIVLNPAIGGAGRDFANAVALVETNLEPPGMLARIKRIERDFGRRSGKHWAARVLDLDIALWSGGRFRSRGLTIPHYGLEKRTFVERYAWFGLPAVGDSVAFGLYRDSSTPTAAGRAYRAAG